MPSPFEFEKPYLIAEIGVNHNGDMDLAKKLIVEAKKAGADAVKFQTFTAEELVGRDVPKVAYQRKTTDPQESHYEMIRRLELDRPSHKLLFDFCQQVGIQFLSTPYGVSSANFLRELGVDWYKVASADIVDFDLLETLAGFGQPVILSTGMATMDEVRDALRILGPTPVVLLHCVSNYPCHDSSLNLRVIETLRDTFRVPVGFSDHTADSLAASVAVAFGCRLFEKHFTLDKNLPGPDHQASMTPVELREMIQNLNRSFSMLGSSVKACQEEEREMARVSRKSLTLKLPLRAGEKLMRDQFCLKRPGTGLLANQWGRIEGARAKVDLEAGSLLKLEDLEF